MADRGEGGFNWIGSANALPMLSWKVEECHEFLAVLLQTQRRLWVFGLVRFDEQIEGLLRVLFGLSLPNVVDCGFGWDSLGRQFSTFMVLCCQHRCWRAVG